MERVGLSEKMVRMLDEKEPRPWTEHFSTKETELLMKMFKEFVEWRGVALSEEGFGKRHPRTVVMSKQRHSRVGKDIEYADKVVEIFDGEARLMNSDKFQPIQA